MPSVATDARKQFECLNAVLNNKTGPLFFEFNRPEKRFRFSKRQQIACIAPLETLNMSMQSWPQSFGVFLVMLSSYLQGL